MGHHTFNPNLPISPGNPKEIVSERCHCTKLYDIGNNQRQIIASTRPIHYIDENGNHQDISTNIENGGVHKCDYDVDLYTDKVGYYGTDADGDFIELELENVPYVEPVINGNVATYVEIEPDVDFVLTFKVTSIKAERVLKTATANKTATYRLKRPGANTDKFINAGVDNTGKKTKLTINETPIGNDSKRMVQTFDGQVFKIDRDTRVREWVNEVEYPVRIDPYYIDTPGDDRTGRRYGTWSISFKTTNVAGLLYSSYGGTPVQNSSSFKFSGITIPLSATITNATIDSHLFKSQAAAGDTIEVKFRADDRLSPSNPTTWQEIISGANGLSPNVLPTPLTTVVTNTAIGVFLSGNYDPYFTDATILVQQLVNTYEYTNDSMIFYAGSDSISSGTQAYAKWAAIAHSDMGAGIEPVLNITFDAGGGGGGGFTGGSSIAGVANANIAKINGVAIADIGKVLGV